MQNLHDTVKISLIEISSISISKENLIYFVIFVLKGQVSVKLDKTEKLLRENDVYLVRKNTAAGLMGRGSNLVLLFELPSDLLEDMLEDVSGIQCDSVSDKGRNYNPLRSILANLAKSHFDTANTSHLLYQSNLYKLMHLLSTDYYNIPVYPDDADEALDKRIIKIRQYIRKNYRYPITMQDLAKHVHLTPLYLSRFIKLNSGENFIDYLNEVRLRNAVKELLSTDNTITSISFNHGFPSMTAFNKVFRQKYHATPLKYRKEHEEKNEPASLDLKQVDFKFAEEHLKQYLNSNFAPGEPEDGKQIDVVLGPLQITDTAWKEIINLGFAPDFLNFDFQQQLLSVQHELNFRYARIEGMFNSDIIDHIPNTPHFNFSNVNKIIDFLLSIHLIPFVELAPKPLKINMSSLDEFHLKGEVDLFSTPEEWEAFLKSFINNCLDRYGIKEVRKWKFENWAYHGHHLEFTDKGLDNFLSFFEKSFKTIKSLLPDIQIGGPGYNLSADEKMFSSILEGLRRINIEPDFVSVYSFHRETSDSLPYFSTKPNYLSWRINAVKKTIRRFKFNCPVYITQWNFDYTSRNYLNDSMFKAAFIIKNILENMDAFSAIGYWLLSDLTSDHMNTDRILFGGNGLTSINSLLKPAYYAYYFLSQLGEKMIKKGEGYIVTTNDENDYQVLLYHYCHPIDFYCLRCDTDVNKNNINDIFGDIKKKTISINVKSISPGKYRIKKLTLNREQGSVLDQWNRMTSIQALSPEEINHLKNISRPGMSIFLEEVTNEIKLSEEMDINEICFFSIKRQLTI
ncbi:helix-turn-helix domain-containing protein [Spirochaetia bacterium]|nr:helix-turn-helix domain-containing protein [Spirochaetia bacterium]